MLNQIVIAGRLIDDPVVEEIEEGKKRAFITVGVKGRLQTETIENEDGTKSYITNVIAEKIIFLSSGRKEN